MNRPHAEQGARLRAMRLDVRPQMSAAKLAKIVGIHMDTVYTYESGERSPELHVAIKIYRACGQPSIPVPSND